MEEAEELLRMAGDSDSAASIWTLMAWMISNRRDEMRSERQSSSSLFSTSPFKACSSQVKAAWEDLSSLSSPVKA